jgi:type IV fimbrial biogenesis protein FimT
MIANPFMRRPDVVIRGFTLIELMVTLTIVVILAGIAAPSFRDMIMNSRMSTQANDLLADLAVARSEASKRGVPVFVCASANGATCSSATNWTTGWLVFADTIVNGVQDGGTPPAEPSLRSRSALAQGNTVKVCKVSGALKPEIDRLAYVPTGVLKDGAGSTISIAMCDTRTSVPDNGRLITISTTGRPTVTKTTCTAAAAC